MFRNYFKVMMSNLWKRKGFAFINLFGLAVGIAICILLVMYIQNETGYDNFHKNGDQIYRLALERKYTTRTAYLGHIPRGIPNAVKTEFPEVLETTQVVAEGTALKVTAGEKKIKEKKLNSAESNFFKVFTARFIEGDPWTALQKPGTAVVNESTAKRYFGSGAKALGQKIMIGDFNIPTIISAVCQDWPEKSHFRFDILQSLSGWGWN